MKKYNLKMINRNNKDNHKMMRNQMKFLMMLKNLRTRMLLKKTISSKTKICLARRLKKHKHKRILKLIEMLKQTKAKTGVKLRPKMQNKKKMKANNRLSLR